MINLEDYNLYWENAGYELGAGHVYAITIDREMARKIQNIGKGETVLFWLPPASKSEGSDADSWREMNSCVVFVMGKYDPQRESSIETLMRTQPLVEKLKKHLLREMASPCSGMKPEEGSIDTMPETDFYGTLAGWSVGFRIKTDEL